VAAELAYAPAEAKMDVLATYNLALQVAAAFLIFIIGYLALLLVLVLCLLVAEAVHQGVIFARTSLSKPVLDPTQLSPALMPVDHRNSAFFEWTHRLAGGLVGSLKHR
jgi:hypothetical protein